MIQNSFVYCSLCEIDNNFSADTIVISTRKKDENKETTS